MKHKHAQNILQYALDALETDEPWKRWEFYSKALDDWETCQYSPLWDTTTDYRRKPGLKQRTPHKHADLITAYSQGAEIEVKTPRGWDYVENPSFLDSCSYRIKPEVTTKTIIFPEGSGSVELTWEHGKLITATVLS